MSHPLDPSLTTLQTVLEQALGERIKHLKRERGELTLTVTAEHYLAVATVLRDHADLKFEQLVDLCGVDYSSYKDQPWEGPRYCVVSHLLSITHNRRLRLKAFCPDDELPVLPSLTPLWNGTNWFEREAFDLFGIIFDGHLDLRRILTDYGFIGHPFRKDFPVSGHVEMHYDEQSKRVIYQPVSIEPREITPRVIREDNYGGLH